MNEFQNDSKQLQLRMLLASIECRLSIVRVANQQVQTKFALVDLTNLGSNTIHFQTPLLLPTDKQFTYAFELVLDTGSFVLSGSRIERHNEQSPYQYTVECDSGWMDRAMLYAKINSMMESAPTAISRAIASYASHFYDQFIPKNDFQT